MTCFRTKTEVLESWIFAVFISLQNASKKRLGSCSTPGSSSGSRNRAWTHSKMIFFQITSNDKVSHFKIAYTCDTLHRSIQFQTWNLHKNAWNFMKLHRPTQFQTWHLHKNMKNCIARHNFKLENDVFSNENGGPGILEFCWQRRPSKCIKKTSWFMLYSGIRYVSLAGDFAQNCVF